MKTIYMNNIVMKKRIHLCCGSIYLQGFENCDVVGKLVSECTEEEFQANETTLENYFKYPFELDVTKRVRRPYIMDTKMNILDRWPWEDNSVSEIILTNAFEHFEYLIEVPHIISEAYRVLKLGGVWKFDFPDIKGIVEKYYESNPEYCMNLLYCNRRDKYSVHKWGYTKESIKNYLSVKQWDFEFKDIIYHDYPIQEIQVTKKSL